MKNRTKTMLGNLLLNTGYTLIAIVVSLLISAIIMLLVGYNPLLAYKSMLDGAFGTRDALAASLSKSIPLMFCGLSFAFAQRSGVFNIGGEGQLYIGALASTVVALALPGSSPFLVVTLAILAGFVAGGLMGIILGFSKAKLGLSEVVVAIMMNYIIQLFTSWVVSEPLLAAGSSNPQSEHIESQFMLRLLIPRTQLSWALLLGLVLCVIVFLFFRQTRFGFDIRVVGENPDAALASGVKVGTTMIIAMGIAGGLAGLAGTTEVLGKYGRFIDGFSTGFGFTGIAVSVLANNHPLGIIFTSILFGAMEAGAMKMSYQAGISTNMVGVIQGLVIVFVATPLLTQRLFKKRTGGLNHE